MNSASRRCLQFHLSTSIAMVVTAGGLLYRGSWFIENFVLTFQSDYSKHFDERFRYSDRLSDFLYFIEVLLIVAFVALVMEYMIRRREARSR